VGPLLGYVHSDRFSEKQSMRRLWYGVLIFVTACTLLLAQPTQAQQQQCDPSHPTVCIAPAPPDLDCADINASNFEVRQPDPHHFNGDQDSVGCEV